MTERAANYYTIDAERLRIPPATILNGHSQPLMAEGQVLSTLAPGDIGVQVRDNFAAVLDSVAPYIMAGHNTPKEKYNSAVLRSSEKYVASIIGPLLLPRSVRFARLAGLLIEAISPSEATETDAINAFSPSKNFPFVRDEGVRRVFFVVSGLLKSSGPQEPCAGMAAVYVNVNNHTKTPTPHYVSARLSKKFAQEWQDRTGKWSNS